MHARGARWTSRRMSVSALRRRVGDEAPRRAFAQAHAHRHLAGAAVVEAGVEAVERVPAGAYRMQAFARAVGCEQQGGLDAREDAETEIGGRALRVEHAVQIEDESLARLDEVRAMRGRRDLGDELVALAPVGMLGRADRGEGHGGMLARTP